MPGKSVSVWRYRIHPIVLAYHKRLIYNGEECDTCDTAETPTIGPCAVSSEIPYSGKAAKNTAKGELLSPSERHGKTKKKKNTRPYQRRQL